MGIFGTKEVVDIAGKVVGIADKLVVDKDAKAGIAAEIISAEMSSGSNFLRSARPMIIYTGLVLIIFEFLGLRLLFLTLIGADSIMVESSTNIFKYFLTVWGSVVAVYSTGRTFEKWKNKKLFK